MRAEYPSGLTVCMKKPPGKRLAEAILAKGLTREKAERLLRVSRGLVSRWIHGQRRPTFENAVRLKERFGIEVEAWAQ